MGAWRSLGVVLDRIDGQFPVPHTLEGLIVQVYMGKFYVFVRERMYVHTEAVILGGYLYLAGAQILHWLVAAAVSKLQFEGGPSHGQAKELVT